MIDLHAVTRSWNEAVGLRGPDLRSLERITGARERARLFEWDSGRVHLGNNFVAVLPVGTAASDHAPVIAVQVVCRPGFYAGAFAERFGLMPAFTIAGKEVPCSAQALLEQVKQEASRDPGRRSSLEVQSTTEEWTVFYGRALGFYFLPTSPRADDPAASELYVVEFNYLLQYDGVMAPKIAAAASGDRG